ncbi:hypothetical protein MHU86_11942 [Fragilaria crotonensis]|nr:hypothetical protein MHU86_11942 [Fragilaria crotonensis]
MEVERRRRQAASSVEWQLQRQDNISPPNDVDCGLPDDVKSRRLLYGSFGNKTPDKVDSDCRAGQMSSSRVFRQQERLPTRSSQSVAVVAVVVVPVVRRPSRSSEDIPNLMHSAPSSQSFGSDSELSQATQAHVEGASSAIWQVWKHNARNLTHAVGRYSELNALNALVTVVWQVTQRRRRSSQSFGSDSELKQCRLTSKVRRLLYGSFGNTTLAI